MNHDKMPTLRTMVVDDSPEYIEALSHLLATYPCIGTISQALSAAEALAQVAIVRPDLMLIDVAMPEVNGLELTRTIKAMQRPPRVIVVTLYDTPVYSEAARAAGADGFIGKSQLGERLKEAIMQIFQEACLSPCAS
jgi:two-component system invasion response regulator UvrY